MPAKAEKFEEFAQYDWDDKRGLARRLCKEIDGRVVMAGETAVTTKVRKILPENYGHQVTNIIVHLDVSWAQSAGGDSVVSFVKNVFVTYAMSPRGPMWWRMFWFDRMIRAVQRLTSQTLQ